jgi:hypothetical protein
MVDAVPEVGVWAFDVLASNAVVELGGAEITHMTEAVPLGAALRV